MGRFNLNQFLTKNKSTSAKYLLNGYFSKYPRSLIIFRKYTPAA